MVSQYAHPHPAVRDFFDGRGWKTLCESPGEGLVWVVRTQESIDKFHQEERVLLRAYDEGLVGDELQVSARYADEFVIADRVELKDNGTLVFSLGSPQNNIAVKAYGHGYWREFHLSSDPIQIAYNTATMYDPEGEDDE